MVNILKNKEELRIRNSHSSSKHPKRTSYYPLYWAESPKPINGESLSSWLIRVSLANLENASSLINNTGNYPSRIDLDLNQISDIIGYYSKKVNILEEELMIMSLLNLKKKIDEIIRKDRTAKVVNDLYFTGWRKRAKNGLRICPICLKEDKIPHLRKIWRLSYIPICLKHKSFLINECPGCESSIIPYEIKWDSQITKCFNCGYDLTKIQPEVILEKDNLLLGYQILNDLKSEEIYKVLSLSWFIANHCHISDVIFKSHPFSKLKELCKIENDNKNTPNKKIYFTNLKLSYLIIGTSVQLYQNKELLDSFLQRFYTSNEYFWTKKPFRCPKLNCGFTETSYIRMQIHINRHNNKRLFHCEECKKEFTTKWDLQNHIKLHNKPHPFKCPAEKCNQEFRHEKQYLHHLRAIHKIKPYPCKICNKTFDRNYNLETHLRTHTGEKPFVCEYCNKNFSQKSELTVHLRIHTGEKPYVCDICGKGFTQSHSLTEHIRTHTDERPYACSKCEKRYKRKHHLDAHIKSHTGEKPFECEKCGKRFSDKGNMKKHMTSHSVERLHICDACGNSYKYSSGLLKHKREKH